MRFSRSNGGLLLIGFRVGRGKKGKGKMRQEYVRTSRCRWSPSTISRSMALNIFLRTFSVNPLLPGSPYYCLETEVGDEKQLSHSFCGYVLFTKVFLQGFHWAKGKKLLCFSLEYQNEILAVKTVMLSWEEKKSVLKLYEQG